MPRHVRSDDKPVVEFDPRLEMSPFVLYRRIRDGNAPLLVDVRRRPGKWTLRGARPFPDADWDWPQDRDIVLFDDDGDEALQIVRGLQESGVERARLLFGGLDLYEFALDPEVVGNDTYLDRMEVS